MNGVTQASLHKESLHIDFSVQPLCSRCLCGVFLLEFINHRDTENTELHREVTFSAKLTQAKISINANNYF